MASKLYVILRKVDVTKPICHHMISKDHTFTHRLAVGVGIMVVGVVIAKFGGEAENAIMSCGADVLGYGLHGIGLTPIIEKMLESFE